MSLNINVPGITDYPRRVCIGVGLVVLMTGCASVPEETGFTDVQAVVTERTGKRVYWRQGKPEDQAVEAAVDELLSQELGVNEAVQIALLNNRRLQATYEELGIAQAALVQAGLLRNPVFDAAVLFPADAGKTEFDLGITQSFLSLLYRPLRQAMAANDLEAAKLRVAGAVIDLAAAVQAVFYRVQADEQQLELLQQVVTATAAAYEAAQRLHEAGNITDLELSNEQVFYSMAKLELAEAEAALLADREQLNVWLGLWGPDTQWHIRRRLPPLPEQALAVNTVEKQAIARSLELAITRRQLENTARRLGFTNATALLSDLEVGALGERNEEADWFVGPRLEFPIPLFDQGQARIASAQAELRRAWEDYGALATEIRAAARLARQRLLLARQRALFIQGMMLPLSNRVVNETQLQYNAMQVGIFQLLNAQQRQIQAARQYINALRDYWLARTQLEQILNGRLPQAALGDAVSAGRTTAAGDAINRGDH